MLREENARTLPALLGPEKSRLALAEGLRADAGPALLT